MNEQKLAQGDNATLFSVKDLQQGYNKVFYTHGHTGNSRRSWGDYPPKIPASYCNTPEYPVVKYFNEAHECYPSIVSASTVIKEVEFDRIAEESSREGVFYIRHLLNEENQDEEPKGTTFFMAIIDKLVIYVTRSYFPEGYREDYAMGEWNHFDIRVFHTPDAIPSKSLEFACNYLKISLIPNPNKHEKPKVGNINILCQNQDGYQLLRSKIKCPEIDFDLNYNSDFQEVSTKIVEVLNQEDQKALFLFPGPPGGGKTTYIRWLTHQSTKRFIFIPPGMAGMLTSPGFIEFLIKHRNSVLIIEDAETALLKRGDVHNSNNQAVSNLLNLTDGLLSDCASIQVICTFNTDVKNIDPALLREGRLTEMYEFGALSEDRAKKLAEKMGKTYDPAKKTLAAIYNDPSISSKVKKETKTIGFNG